MADYSFAVMEENTLRDLSEAAGHWLLARGATVACAESCTGGLLTSTLTDVSGSSVYVKGAVVSYSDEAKERLAGVRAETLAEHGAVSAETAREMAEGVREKIGADFAISITGFAGPDTGLTEQPTGLVYIAVAGSHGTAVRENRFQGSRRAIKLRSVATALCMLIDYNMY